MAYASWSVVFGEQPSAAKWNILGTNDAFFDSLIGSGTAWTSWVPTWANLTIGNATVAAKYQQFGKTVHFRINVTLGSTSSVGTSPTFTLPVTSAALALANYPIGPLRITDTGTATFVAWMLHGTTTTAGLIAFDANSTFPRESTITASNPMVWTTGDVLQGIGTYEAA